MKFIKFSLSIALVAMCCLTASFAQSIDEYNAALIARQPAQAQMLHDLGLFQGTDKGFELEKVMSRGEAAVMLVRLLGAEKEALTNNHKSPFTDVPEWLSPYIGWLYQNKLTAGTSKTTYSPSSIIICDQYAMFLQRALSSKMTSDYQTTLLPQAIMELAKTPLTRGNAVEVSARALEQEVSTGCETLAEVLIGNGIFTEDALIKASKDVYSTEQLYRGMLAEFPINIYFRQNYNKACYPPDETQYIDCGVTFSQRKNVLYAHNKTTGKNTIVGSVNRTDEVQWQFATCVGNNIYLYQYNDLDEACNPARTSKLIKYDIANDTPSILHNNLPIIYRYDFNASKIYMGGFGGLYEIDNVSGAVTQLHDMEVMQTSDGRSLASKNVFPTSLGALSTLRNGNIALSDFKGNTQILVDLERDFPKLFAAGFWLRFTDYDLESYDGKILKFTRLCDRDEAGKPSYLLKLSFILDLSTKKLTCTNVTWPTYPNGTASTLELQAILLAPDGNELHEKSTIVEYLKKCLIVFNKLFDQQ